MAASIPGPIYAPLKLVCKKLWSQNLRVSIFPWTQRQEPINPQSDTRCTCPIGADSDPTAVLDSKFRVRGVTGVSVVDASVYPRIPGTFTAVPTCMVGENAADIILHQFGQTSLTAPVFCSRPDKVVWTHT